jgi:hypothetical protein
VNRLLTTATTRHAQSTTGAPEAPPLSDMACFTL